MIQEPASTAASGATNPPTVEMRLSIHALPSSPEGPAVPAEDIRVLSYSWGLSGDFSPWSSSQGGMTLQHVPRATATQLHLTAVTGRYSPALARACNENFRIDRVDLQAFCRTHPGQEFVLMLERVWVASFQASGHETSDSGLTDQISLGFHTLVIRFRESEANRWTEATLAVNP